MKPPTKTNDRDDSLLDSIATAINKRIEHKRRGELHQATHYGDKAKQLETQWREKNGLKPTT